MKRGAHLFVSLGALAMLAGCGDGAKEEAAALDTGLLGKGNATDPALTSALEDQILVDPSLTEQANTHAARAADQPAQAPVPTEAAGGPAQTSTNSTLGQRVAQQAAKQAPAPATAGNVGPSSVPGASYGADPARQAIASNASPAPIPGGAEIPQGSFNGCGMNVTYSMTWSNRMPADLPLYPQARVAEAAGSDNGSCSLRAVTFSTSASPRSIIDYYLTTAKRGGYTAEYSTEGGEQIVTGTRADGAAFYVIITPRASGGAVADVVANRGG